MFTGLKRWLAKSAARDIGSDETRRGVVERSQKAAVAATSAGSSDGPGYQTDQQYNAPGLLPVGQGTIVKTNSQYVETLFDRLSDDTLLDVAQALAILAPLQPVPHWRFGGFADSSDLAVHVRHSLWLSAKRRGLLRPIIVSWHGGTKLALHLDNDLSLTFFPTGYFEPNEFALINRILRPGMIFVDGGANEGMYTLFASAKVGSKGRVIAVEPSPRELIRLRKNIQLNDAHNIDLMEMALADRPGVLQLRIAEGEHAGQNTLGDFAYEGVQTAGMKSVVATTLDDIIRRQAVDRVDVVKLDLEGAEIRALRGARDVLRRLKPLLLIEVNDAALRHQGGHPSELLDLLSEENYAILAIDDATGEPVPLRSPSSQLSSNIVAVHHQRDWGLSP